MFKNKIALVTGGGKHIGRAIVEEFFNQGAKVIINDKKDIHETEIKTEILNCKERVLYSQGDITNLKYQDNLVKQSLNKFDPVEILINNVGIGSGKGFFDLDIKEMEKSYKTNVWASFFLSQKIAKIMIEKKIQGTIIFISSIHSRIPSGNADYSSSKAAIEMLVKEMAFDLGKYGIRVNGVAPGRITTNKIKDKRIPLLNLTGVPSEIAKVVCFLADNNLAGYITGEIINVDGGLSLVSPR